MRPVLIAQGRLRIRSYAAFLWLGATLGAVAENYAANTAGLGATGVWVATLILLPVAIIGARLLFVVCASRSYRRLPGCIFRFGEGGLALYGAIPTMLLVSIPVLAWLGVSYWRFWDVSVFCILVGMIFTRVGCILNGCCGGKLADGWLGVTLADHHGVRARRIPTQLLEAGLGLALLCAAAASWRRLPAGELFLLTLIGYALGRFALQPTRATRTLVNGVDIQQAISVAVAVVALAMLLLMHV